MKDLLRLSTYLYATEEGGERNVFLRNQRGEKQAELAEQHRLASNKHFHEVETGSLNKETNLVKELYFLK